MKTELKDVIHFYIGCKVTHVTRDKEVIDIERMIGVSESEMHPGQITVITSDNHTEWAVSDVLPILRRLSSMTHEERKAIFQLVFKRPFVGDHITRHDDGTKKARWVLWSGVDRLFIYDDGDIGADCDLHYFTIHQPTIVKHLLKEGFDLFNLINSGQAIEQTPEKS